MTRERAFSGREPLPRRRWVLERSALVLSAALVGPLASGCSCDEDKPYTPFAVATSLPSESPTEAKPAVTEPTTKSGVVVGETPKTPGARWTIFERELRAPKNTVFASAVTHRGAQGTAPERVFAWVRASGAGGEAGLWEFGEDGNAEKKHLGPPAFLPSGPDCEEIARLSTSGQTTLAIELTRRCASRQLPGTPDRALLVTEFDGGSPALTLRLAPLSPGETVDLTVDGADRDGDGTDDVTVKFDFGFGEQPKESFSFAWLRRPAGLSRDKDLPARDFTARASRLVLGGKRKAERARVPTQVETFRRFFGAVCAESSTAKVTLGDGSPLSCGISEKAFGSLVQANVYAYLGLGRSARALGEFSRSDWTGATPASVDEATLEKALLEKIPSGAPSSLAEIETALPALSTEPELPPLRFENGVVYVDDGRSVTRLWPALPEPTPSPDEDEANSAPPAPELPAARSRRPSGAHGERVALVLPACDRAEVLAAITNDAGVASPALPLPLLAPRPGQCRRLGGAPLAAVLLGFGDTAPDLVVGGEYFPGSSAAEGRVVAVPTSLGLAVQRGPELELWTDSRLHEGLLCTIEADRSRAACAGGRSVTIWKRPETIAVVASTPAKK